MMRLISQYVLASIMAVVLSSEIASAQFIQGIGENLAFGSGQQAISALGTSTLKRKPATLRMYLELVAKGSNTEEALKKMKERRENVRVQLETLKADKKTINFGNPSLSNIQSARQKQVEAMLMERMRSRGKKPGKNAQASSPVNVTVMLTAQWPLEAETPEQMLLMAQTLQEKVKTADLAGAKDAEKLSPEEEELAEEAAQMMDSSGESRMQAGQPHFVFVAVLSKEDREKLLADAFDKAKIQAADLAKAANVDLGPLTGLSGRCGGQRNFGEEEYNPYGGSSNIRRLLAMQIGEIETQNEAVNNDPAEISFFATVQANFRLGK